MLFRLCTADTTHRHSVVSLLDHGKYGEPLRQSGVDVYTLGLGRGRLNVGSLVALWRIIRRINPDLVQTWMYHADVIGGIAARAAGIRNILWNIRHTVLDPRYSKRSTILLARLSAVLSRWVPKKVVLCAHAAVEPHIRLGYVAEKFVVIPNGYDLRRFFPDTSARARLRAEWGVPERISLLGMVGRFHPEKDHQNLIKALASVRASGRNFRCVLVGRGLEDTNEELINMLIRHELRDQVILAGPRNDIPNVMNAIDIHVLSSATEGFPNVLAEAMACGTPCVTTDVGDAGLIVGETGWVVPPRDADALTNAIKKALAEREHDSSWVQRQVHARRRITESFSLDAMVKAYHQAWAP